MNICEQELTERELKVVLLIIDGYDNRDIARQMYISIHTVKIHIHNILQKWSLISRVQIAVAIRQKQQILDWLYQGECI